VPLQQPAAAAPPPSSQQQAASSCSSLAAEHGDYVLEKWFTNLPSNVCR